MSTQPAYRRTAAERTAAILAPNEITRRGFAYAGNHIVRQVIPGKPHIVLINGLYRVSQLKKSDRVRQDAWAAAYAWILPMNNERLAAAGRLKQTDLS